MKMKMKKTNWKGLKLNLIIKQVKQEIGEQEK